MRLSCVVEVSNRLAPSLNIRASKGSSKSQLALGLKPATIDKTVYIMLSTAQNSSGTFYKIHQNVETVFAKFLSEGKANIRLKNPQCDIIISKADPTQLKAFLVTLKAVITKGKLDENGEAKSASDRPTLSCLTPVTGKEFEKRKTRTVISCRKNYPVCEGFATTLEHLQVTNCSLKRLDSRILKCKNLSYLDLSSNKLTDVPTELSQLTALAHLNLACNQIDGFSDELCQGNMQNTLRTIDLSGNPALKRLPSSLWKLRQLHTLRTDVCSLVYLPSRIGELSSLKILSMENNQLQTLPYSFLKLKLDTLNLTGNPFVQPNSMRKRLLLPSLGEWAARSIKSNRLPVSEEHVTTDLWNYLCSAKWCPCGGPCFVSFVCYLAAVDLRQISVQCQELSVKDACVAPVEAFLCSQRCLNLYLENPHRRDWARKSTRNTPPANNTVLMGSAW